MAQTWKKVARQKPSGEHRSGNLVLSAVMPSLSVFVDVPLAQKLEGSLLKTYKQDNYPNKMFLAYKGRGVVVFGGVRCSTRQSPLEAHCDTAAEESGHSPRLPGQRGPFLVIGLPSREKSSKCPQAFCVLCPSPGASRNVVRAVSFLPALCLQPA